MLAAHFAKHGFVRNGGVAPTLDQAVEAVVDALVLAKQCYLSSFVIMEIPSIRRYGPAAATILGAVGLLVFVSELYHGYEFWRVIVDFVHRSVPMPVFALVTLLLLLVGLGPAAKRRWEHRNQQRGRVGLADTLERQQIALQAEVTSLQQQVAEGEALAERLRGMLMDARKKSDEVQAKLDKTTKGAWSLRQRLDYGVEFPSYEDLSPKDLEAVISKAWDLYHPWLTAVEASRSLWTVIGRTARADVNSLGARLWMRIEAREHGRVERALTAFKEALDHGKDPRRYMTRLYTCYMDWRWLMMPLAKRLPEKVSMNPQCGNVRLVEQRLWEELATKLDPPVFRVVKLSMRDYEEGHGSFDEGAWPRSDS